MVSSCASLASYQTAKTTPKDEGEFGASLDIVGITDGFDNQNLALPNINLWGRYGVGNKTDIGLRLSTSLNIMFDLKQQIIGDQQSKFALALGGGLGFVPLGKLIFQYHVPLYISVHPKDNFAYYLTPRYIHQYGINYLGTSVGLQFGRKTKFAFDISYAGSLNTTTIVEDINLGNGLFNIGWGIKVPIR